MDTLAETLKAARTKAEDLRKERLARPDPSQHADDRRIATEIAAHQFELGKIQHAIIEQNKRMQTAMAKNCELYGEIDEAFELLQRELNIATHRKSDSEYLTAMQPPQCPS